jgi:two-component system, NarL family, sensor kinase
MLGDANETSATPHAPLTAVAQADAHLRRAELEVSWLRWLGMASWALILLRGEFTVAARVAWAIYGGGIVYTALSHWSIVSSKSIALTARLTTVGDPLIAAAISLVTGGINSIFYTFFYFTLLATAFRYGAREALMTLALNTALSIFLFAFAPGSPATAGDLAIAIYYLVFSAILGVMLAHWARENLDLALVRSEALRQAGDQMRSLLQRLMHAHEAERKHVAGEIHDRLGARLFALQQGIASAAGTAADEATRASLKALEVEARAFAGDVRAMMNDLRPTVLDDFGLNEALNEYVAALDPTAPFELKLDIDPQLRNWRSGADAALFRIVQESLLNVRKHAAAKHATVTLARQGLEVELTIADDGEGFDPDAVGPRHFGLLTMRERAEAFGGRIAIESAWGAGTKVIVRIPAGAPS